MVGWGLNQSYLHMPRKIQTNWKVAGGGEKGWMVLCVAAILRPAASSRAVGRGGVRGVSGQPASAFTRNGLNQVG